MQFNAVFLPKLVVNFPIIDGQSRYRNIAGTSICIRSWRDRMVNLALEFQHDFTRQSSRLHQPMRLCSL
jgi:hypothetical protein